MNEAIAVAQAFGAARGLEVVIQRVWLVRRKPVWMPDTLVLTPEGTGIVMDYDGETDRYLVQLDVGGTLRSYQASELSRVPA